MGCLLDSLWDVSDAPHGCSPKLPKGSRNREVNHEEGERMTCQGKRCSSVITLIAWRKAFKVFGNAVLGFSTQGRACATCLLPSRGVLGQKLSAMVSQMGA